MSKLVTVLGGGGFIGSHLVKRLLEEGNEVWVADIKPSAEWHQWHDDARNFVCTDLSDLNNALNVIPEGVDEVYLHAANMGGIGFIESEPLACMWSTKITTACLEAAVIAGAKRIFYSSSACAYPVERQDILNGFPLNEAMLYNGRSEYGYGEEKLFGVSQCEIINNHTDTKTRVGVYHNIYGPCFDDQTEVLTDDGWKYFAKLDRTEAIASLNPETNQIEYLRPIAFQSYLYSGDMYKVASNNVDQLITPDHKIYYSWPNNNKIRKAKRAPFRLQAAKESKWDRASMLFASKSDPIHKEDKTPYTMPPCYRTDGKQRWPEKSIDIYDWFTFAGWYISEGSSWVTPSNYTVTITQNPGSLQDEIVELINRMGFKPYVNGKNIIMSNKQLYESCAQFGMHCENKIIPQWMIMHSDYNARKCLFDSLIKGDGDKGRNRYTTNSESLKDTFMHLAISLGMDTKSSFKDNIYRIYYDTHSDKWTTREQRSIEKYEGFVYDVTLPKNHILMIRRNGKICWSGNCGTYDGGREKAPAALSRKVAEAVLSGNHVIDIWGDGEQQRTFCYIDDCIEGTIRLMRSDYSGPVNIGSDELVSINQMVDILEDIAGVKLERRYQLDKPTGVRGRSSDNSLCRSVLDWEPSISLREGLEKTYNWIYEQIKNGKEN